MRPETYHKDGQIMDEVYVFGSFIQSKMYHKGISARTVTIHIVSKLNTMTIAFVLPAINIRRRNMTPVLTITINREVKGHPVLNATCLKQPIWPLILAEIIA